MAILHEAQKEERKKVIKNMKKTTIIMLCLALLLLAVLTGCQNSTPPSPLSVAPMGGGENVVSDVKCTTNQQCADHVASVSGRSDIPAACNSDGLCVFTFGVN